MDKKFISQYVVIYNYYNHVSYIVFAGSASVAHNFVANIVAGLSAPKDLDNVSSLDLVDLSQGCYYSETASEEMMPLFAQNRISKFVHASSSEMVDGSEEIQEGVYYLPSNIDVTAHYDFDADELAEAIYPTM